MSALGSKLRTLEGGIIMFQCPGCKEAHAVRVTSPCGQNWTFNGDGDRPTFSPSVLVTGGHYMPGHKSGDPCWCNYAKRYPHKANVPFKCDRCHSFVKEGMIQFLGDCTHELAGQTVPLPDWKEEGA